MKKTKRIYIAAPLFSSAELEFNKHIKMILSKYFDVYLPQEDGGLMSDLIQFGITPDKAAQIIYKKDIQELNKCDLLLIILDGRSVDEGAAFELGYMVSNEKSCFGLQTDSRRLIKNMNNPMLDCSLNKIITNTKELENWASTYTESISTEKSSQHVHNRDKPTHED